MHQITTQEYARLVDSVLPRVSLLKTGAWAFLIGGFICCFAELCRCWILCFSVNEQDAGVLVSAILIFITAISTGFGLFHKLAKFGGAGTFVPITGFANAVVSPALEFKTEGFILGVSSKMFIIAGPVIVYGVISAMMMGLIFQICFWFGVVA